MKFTTTRFGEIEFPEEVVMTFPEGVLGFPDERRYILLEHDAEGSPFKWLQSLDNPDLAFIVMDPLMIEPQYRFDVDVDTARMIGTERPEDCALMAIINVPHEQPIRMTANLKAPLIVNVVNRTGRQLVLSTNHFLINTPVFPQLVAVEESEATAGALVQRAAG